MRKNFQGLMPDTTEQLRAELVVDHLINPDDFVSGTFTLGADEGWREALDRKAREQIKKAKENPDLRPNEVACEERSIIRKTGYRFRKTPPENWNIYSVGITNKGVLLTGLHFAGHRKHPSIRTREKGEVRFDCTGTQVKVYFPPLTWEYAMHLLDHHGFICTREEYAPEMAWQFIFSNPEVPVWVEELALKALSSTSHGQLAFGINGINSGGQKSRSDRLRVPLQMLAKGGRKLYPDFYCRQFGITIDVLKSELMELAKRGLLTITDRKTAKGHLWLEVIGTADLQRALRRTAGGAIEVHYSARLAEGDRSTGQETRRILQLGHID